MCFKITDDLFSFTSPYIPRYKDYSTIKLIALSALAGMVLWFTYVACFSERKIVKQQPGRSKIPASPHAQKISKADSKVGKPSETKTTRNQEGETSKSSPILHADTPLKDITITVEKKKTAQNSKDVDQSIEPEGHRTKKQAAASLQKIQRIKDKNAEQVKLFEAWASESKWDTFKPKYSHYDWWAFPIKRPSRGYGYRFAVNEEEIQTLKADEVFMRHYRTGVKLVVKSWGWDLTTDAPIPQSERTPYQSWTGYEVRLGKMADSLQLFGEQDLYDRLKHFFDEVCVTSAEKYPLSEWVCKLFGRPCPSSK